MFRHAFLQAWGLLNPEVTTTAAVFDGISAIPSKSRGGVLTVADLLPFSNPLFVWTAEGMNRCSLLPLSLVHVCWFRLD